jgi:hypothetical protein
MQSLRTLLTTSLLCMALAAPAHAAGDPRSAELLAAQARAMAPLSIFDGLWRGPATVTLPDGKTLQLTQTERVGSMLGGTLKVIEGRGYLPDGSAGFNAFAVISFSPQAGKYAFRSHAQGYAGDFPLEVRPDGFTWSTPAGPGATIRYTATLKDGVWTEIGERVVEGKPPMKMFEMQLKRIGSTDWPAGGAVPKE